MLTFRPQVIGRGHGRAVAGAQGVEDPQPGGRDEQALERSSTPASYGRSPSVRAWTPRGQVIS
ncbi:hypothetical protein ACIBP6_46675 [Nonomuraea terrae]|uniref:hypothetical protein n=1 Tax=Nonomuraea terrae TaxID=2530383 RepID=UPI0037AFE7F9